MRLVTRGIAACALSLPVMVGTAAMASANTGMHNYTTNNATTNNTTNNYGIRVQTPTTYHPANYSMNNYGNQGAAAGPLGSAEFSNGSAACGGAMFHASGVFATQWGAGIVNDDSAAGSWNWRCANSHHEHHHHGHGFFWED